MEKEKKTLDEELEKIKSWNKYEDGISVIIPTYKGDNHIKTLLESLEKQTLDYEKYEAYAAGICRVHACTGPRGVSDECGGGRD